MATANKRHQARNEQALQDLLRSVPGNDRCADCQARNPGWASWSLGIFLCVRCASLHRKLGTHISKVKSLSMDAWAADQVETMRRFGNTASNQKYNPNNTKPPIPLDADEIDAAMERFIRAKYDQKSYMAGATQLSRSQTMPVPRSQSNDLPYAREIEPPLPSQDPPTPPPKSGRKFGLSFRSASSTFGRKKDKPEPTRHASGAAVPGKVISAAFGVTDEGMEWKLVQLREMGFPDDKRNSSILKGVNGDLERAIESLVRLGEGATSVRRPAQNVQDTAQMGNPTSAQRNGGSEFGVQFRSNTPTTSQSESKPSAPPANQPQQNFWDNLGPPTASSAAPQPLENAFQNMQINSSMQPQAQPQSLFPNLTGGTPQQSPHPYGYGNQAPFQQSMTPPVPNMPQRFVNNPYSPSLTHNPFMSSPTQQSPYSTGNPFANMQPASQQSNPFLTHAVMSSNSNPMQSTQTMNPSQQPMQQQWMPQPVQQPGSQFGQQNFEMPMQQPQQMVPQQMAPQQAGAQSYWNPYQQQQSQQSFHAQQQIQPGLSQAPARIDKSNILALYNYPQLAPQAVNQHPGLPVNGDSQPQPVRGPGDFVPQRSVTMPVSGTKNPFAMASPSAPLQSPGGMDERGRHSPDAFASLSSRSVI